MRVLLPLTSCTSILLLLGAAVLAPDLALSKADPDEAQEAEAKAPPQARPRAGLWWKDPRMTEVLSLSEEQQKKMDAQLGTYRESLPEEGRRKAFHEALVKKDWKDAGTELEKMSNLASESVRRRGDLKIAVLSELSAEQHKMIIDRYPRLIYQPWRQAMRGQPR